MQQVELMTKGRRDDDSHFVDFVFLSDRCHLAMVRQEDQLGSSQALDPFQVSCCSLRHTIAIHAAQPIELILTAALWCSWCSGTIDYA
jgi:hypothetical protein